MYRKQRLVIRLSEEEAATVKQFAESEKLPISTLTRRLLLKQAEKHILAIEGASAPKRGQNEVATP